LLQLPAKGRNRDHGERMQLKNDLLRLKALVIFRQQLLLHQDFGFKRDPREFQTSK